MAILYDLPCSALHQIFGYLSLMESRRLARTSRRMRNAAFTLPDKYRKKTNLIVEDVYGRKNAISCHFALPRDYVCSTVKPELARMMSHRFSNQKDACLAIEGLLRIAKVQKMTMMSAFPRPWTKWADICDAVIKFSNQDVLMDINLTPSKRDDIGSLTEPPGSEEMFAVVARVCVATFLTDLVRRGVRRLGITYNFEVYTLDVIPFNKFSYLNLGLFLPMTNAIDHKRNKDVFFGFIKRYLSGDFENSCFILSILIRDPGWDIDPFDKELNDMARQLRQLNQGCCMSDEESNVFSVWQTINKKRFRISWQSMVPTQGYVTLRVMASDDRQKGAPTVKQMDDKMKKLRKECPHMAGLNMS